MTQQTGSLDQYANVLLAKGLVLDLPPFLGERQMLGQYLALSAQQRILISSESDTTLLPPNTDIRVHACEPVILQSNSQTDRLW